ncbi:hypothetical protein IMCC21906_02224 [Spongiibacter sp. IMCC21906]|jgi:predicted  nucleic acid-binding Zn-ribbon protein|uniref:hypothetical protein n=1 Tax=Spongiibacter sp. IMCC21906 TaxID=1620392 RepID=UPI00062DDADC|nr:hypothetical protein [Spongiibacter sp. IMCC21906]AKH69887.1 hypothetical protein IMCC21906_02224 [Spongiibacter sp. IMCC21906]
MKFVGVFLVVLLLVAILAVDYLQFQHSQTSRAALHSEISHLNERINGLEGQLSTVKAELNKMENSSLGGVINNANEALIEGWSAMIDAVERQLDQAKENMAKDKTPSN